MKINCFESPELRKRPIDTVFRDYDNDGQKRARERPKNNKKLRSSKFAKKAKRDHK